MARRSPGHGEAPAGLHSGHHRLAAVHRAVRQLRRGARRGPQPRAGRGAARHAPDGDWPRNASIRQRRDRAQTTPASRRRTCARDDVVLVEAQDTIPADGEVIEGVASVDESAITGESAPVIRESGGDFSSVTGGTRVLSDWIVVRVTVNPGETFLDRMISMVEGGQAAEDAQRDRADHPAGGADARVPGRHRHAAAVLAVQRRGQQGGQPRSPSPRWWRCSSA